MIKYIVTENILENKIDIRMHQSINKSNTNTTDFPSNTASPHTKALANKLCDHMGIDSAIRISTEKQWHGVLSVLEDIKARKS